MAFNAKWALVELSAARSINMGILLRYFLDDFATLVKSAFVYRLDIADNGNYFVLKYANGESLNTNLIPPVPGFYSIFTLRYVVYLGETGDLRRRFFKDPDNTADSSKRFINQGKAIIKYLMYHRHLSDVGIEDLLVQVYPASSKLERNAGCTFGSFYQLDVEQYRQSFEGVLAIVSQSNHKAMAAQAINAGFVIPRSS